VIVPDGWLDELLLEDAQAASRTAAVQAPMDLPIFVGFTLILLCPM